MAGKTEADAFTGSVWGDSVAIGDVEASPEAGGPVAGGGVEREVKMFAPSDIGETGDCKVCSTCVCWASMRPVTCRRVMFDCNYTSAD